MYIIYNEEHEENQSSRIAWLIFLFEQLKQIKHTICVEEAAEIDDFENGDANHCRVALYTSVVAIAARHIRELGYPKPIGKQRLLRL